VPTFVRLLQVTSGRLLGPRISSLNIRDLQYVTPFDLAGGLHVLCHLKTSSWRLSWTIRDVVRKEDRRGRNDEAQMPDDYTANICVNSLVLYQEAVKKIELKMIA
jgi:hypothetical protein